MSTMDGICGGECVLCRKVTACVCQRCGDYYCSRECQRKDWPSHRYICFPMPPLVKPTVDFSTPPQVHTTNQETNPQLLKQILKINSNETTSNNNCAKEQNQQSYGNKHTVPTQYPFVLMGFRSCNRCYVRSLAPKDNEDFVKVINTIKEFGKTAAPLQEHPHQRTYAICELNGTMYRVQVLSGSNAQNIEVLFIDYGWVKTCKLLDLRKISTDIVKLKQHSFQVQLHKVKNYEVCEESMRYLSQFEEIKLKMKTLKHDFVTLYNWENNESLNDKINQYFIKDALNTNNEQQIDSTSSTSSMYYSSNKKKIPPAKQYKGKNEQQIDSNSSIRSMNYSRTK